MKKNIYLKILFVIFIFSSCGIISKTRYGNGYKLNIEFNKKEKNKYFVAKSAQKKTLNLSKLLEKRDQKTDSNTFSTYFVETGPLHKVSKLKIDYKFEKVKKPISKLKNINVQKTLLENKPKTEKKPLEKHIKVAAWLFYGGLVLIIFLPLIGGLMMLAGFILAIISYINIRRSGYELRGEGLAVSIIAFCLLLLIISMSLYFLPFLTLF